MDWSEQCTAVVPCYNEAGGIGGVVEDIRRYLPNVIVADDGSFDGTAEAARSAGADTERVPVNRGKGAALRRGWKLAHERGFKWALTMDGDGQHSAEDIPKFFDCAQKTGARLVIGNRMGHEEAMPWLRRRVNRWMSRDLSRLTATLLPDTQCGFRLAHLETLQRLPLASDRFEIESETLVSFLAAGYAVKFVPVTVIYNFGRSKIHPLPDTWRWLKWRAAQGRALRDGASVPGYAEPYSTYSR